MCIRDRLEVEKSKRADTVQHHRMCVKTAKKTDKCFLIIHLSPVCTRYKCLAVSVCLGKRE